MLAGCLLDSMLFGPGGVADAETNGVEIIHMRASSLSLGKTSGIQVGRNEIRLVLDSTKVLPFNQSAVKQSTAPAQQGPCKTGESLYYQTRN
jgi:hypothetical protein